MDSDSRNEANEKPEIIRAEVVVERATEMPWDREDEYLTPRRRRWKLPLLLFVATCLSTFWAQSGDALAAGYFRLGLYYGLWYAIPVMTILMCHEMGHFIQARRYGVYSSLPFFIPMPFGPIGTFGAVIAMEPRMGHRRALFDIGITGPLLGLVPTMIFLIVGLRYSKPGLPSADQPIFGDPLLFQLLTKWILGPIPKPLQVICHPMAFAGWVGLLITSLNLIPIGQLDGGHVLYALLRQRANGVAKLLLLGAITIVLLNFRTYFNWFVMLVLLVMMGPTHPPTANDEEPLGWFRTLLGWLTLAFIVVGFTPTPLLYIPP